MRNLRLQSNLFPMLIEHTRGRTRTAGTNLWKFPDVVVLDWQVNKQVDQGYGLDPHLLAVRTSLGEQPFSLQSIELKVAVSLATFRENFFQCLSNSKWAHKAILAVANSVDDEVLNRELQRLGASYDISVVSYGLSDQVLEKLPAASKIHAMEDSVFESEVAPKMKETTISSGKAREALDWEHIRDLRNQSKEFADLFEWIARCLNDKKAHSFKTFEELRAIDRRNA